MAALGVTTPAGMSSSRTIVGDVAPSTMVDMHSAQTAELAQTLNRKQEPQDKHLANWPFASKIEPWTVNVSTEEA
jgi:hypothetical protein